MGLGLEDPSGNNALASLREDVSDGEALDAAGMDVEPDVVRIRRNSPDRRIIPRAASGSSALGIKGLLDSNEDWHSEEVPRPYSESRRARHAGFLNDDTERTSFTSSNP